MTDPSDPRPPQRLRFNFTTTAQRSTSIDRFSDDPVYDMTLVEPLPWPDAQDPRTAALFSAGAPAGLRRGIRAVRADQSLAGVLSGWATETAVLLPLESSYCAYAVVDQQRRRPGRCRGRAAGADEQAGAPGSPPPRRGQPRGGRRRARRGAG